MEFISKFIVQVPHLIFRSSHIEPKKERKKNNDNAVDSDYDQGHLKLSKLTFIHKH